ncbi:hypothetical protein NNG48_07130 [Enterococcus faecium]|nr:hypothetical protein [Enterococcus faecium]
MPKFIFTLYDKKTGRFEEAYYTAENFDEALALLANDYELGIERYIIEDWNLI